MTRPNDPIIDALRAQALECDPQPPAHLNRRIRSALAAVEMPGGGSSRGHGAARWPVAATIVVGAVLAAAMIVQHLRPWSRELVKIPPGQQPSNAVAATTPHPLIASSANPLVLTQRWIEAPIRTEMDGLLTDLSRTRDTVVRVLPAASKRARPTTVKGTSRGA
jgi:hypothetical protein